MESVSSQAAIVTGGSSGIGLAIAESLIAGGMAVTIVARDPERLAAAAAALDPSGARVRTVSANMNDAESPALILAEHLAAFGSLNVLVNNAGVGVLETIDSLTVRRVTMQFEVNLRAAMLMSQVAVEPLRRAAAGGGNALIVNIASASARQPERGLSVYASLKSGLVAFTRATNLELGKDGIRATAVCPGFVDTPLVEYAHDHVPPETMIAATDVAESVAMLTRLSPNCVVPVLDLERPGGLVW